MADDKYRYLEELERSERIDGANRRKGKRLSPEQRRRNKQRRRRKRILGYIGRVLLLVLLVAAFVGLIHTVMKRIGGNENPDPKPAGSTVTPASEETSPAENVTETPAPTSEPTAEPTAEPTKAPQESSMVRIYGAWTYSTDAQAPDGEIVPESYLMYDYERMRQDIYFLTKRYSDYCEAVSLATTADGREIVDVVVGSPDAEKDLIIQYSIHAREYINTQIGMRHLQSYLQSVSSGERSHIWQNLRIHFIPMMNPDGVTLSQFGFDSVNDPEILANIKTIWGRDNEAGKGDPDSMGYCSRWKANMRGVDLNRNFDIGWETTGGSAAASCTRYKGPSAASEIETQALVKLAKNTNCVGQVAYHSEGNVVYWDYGTTGELYETDSALAEAVVNVTGYRKASTIATDQNLGGCSDYFILVLGVPAITVETGGWYDWPADYEAEWPALYDRNRDVIFALSDFFYNH